MISLPRIHPSRARPAAVVLGAFLALVAAFQTYWALGGTWAMSEVLGREIGDPSIPLRLASGVVAVFLVGAALVVLARVDIWRGRLPSSVVRWGPRALTVILVFIGLNNLGAETAWERFAFGPFALVLALLSAIVALSRPPSRTGNDGSVRKTTRTSARMTPLPVVAALLVAVVVAAPALGARQEATELVSVGRGATSGKGASQNPDVSASGRYVAFQSFAADLVAPDRNRAFDVFVRDRKTGRTTRVSVSSTGREADGGSVEPSISADGRFVAFASEATNLVPGDRNVTTDLFLHDRLTGRTVRVSVSSSGREANGESAGATVSASERFVAFTSEARNLVRRDRNGATDVFLHDTRTGRTTRANVSSSGREARGETITVTPALSADGRFVAFDSTASNLVRGDRNGEADVFLRDRRTGTTTRVSVTGRGRDGNGDSFNPSLSANRRFLAFNSLASNLVRGDTNRLMDVFVRDRAKRRTTRVSVDSAGRQSVGRRDADDPGTYGESGDADISADGRFVTFYSTALNLEPRDENDAPDVFVRDRVGGTIRRASVTWEGGEATDWNVTPEISADGRFVVFLSDAENLVRGDANGAADVFAHMASSGPRPQRLQRSAP